MFLFAFFCLLVGSSFIFWSYKVLPCVAMFFMSDLFGEELQGDAPTSFGKLVQITEQLTVGLSAFWCFLMLSEGRLVTRLASYPFFGSHLPGLTRSYLIICCWLIHWDGAPPASFGHPSFQEPARQGLVCSAQKGVMERPWDGNMDTQWTQWLW